MRMITTMLDEAAELIDRHFSLPRDDPERVSQWMDWMAKGLDPELSYTCAGINHMAFFLRFESGGRDLYPILNEAFRYPHILRFDPVRFQLFKHLGYFMTETSQHSAEYVPFFLKDKTEIEKHFIRVSIYLDTCKRQERQYRELKEKIAAGEAMLPSPHAISNEYVSRIINGVVTDSPYIFNGNVHNGGGSLIRNLPGDCCVEVPCVANRQGIRALPVGELPPQCAAMIRSNIKRSGPRGQGHSRRTPRGHPPGGHAGSQYFEPIVP